MTNVAENLQKVVEVIADYEALIDKDGSRFNIFSILGLSSQEVRLHSTFIAELLDSKGTHSFGNIFCKLFLKEISLFEKNDIISNFNVENYSVEVEKYIGKVSNDYSTGGRIDICLCDNFSRRIIIENKIYAYDQENQLLRYYNYDKNAFLIYLTLFGEEASNWSTSNILIKGEDYYCISYREFISNWLKICISICDARPKVKNTIEQYLNVIENYTEQSYTHKMSEEIINLISENKEFYNSVDEITIAYNNLRHRIHSNFNHQIEIKKPNELVCKTDDDYEVKYLIAEDNEGFFYGFCVEKLGVSISGNDSQISHIANMFKQINSDFQNNEAYVGWIFSQHFRKFFWQDKEKIFDLNSNEKMNVFTDLIITEVKYYVDNVKKLLNNACR